MAIEENALYIASPDVSCREEEPDGALLFNPDTDEVLVVNITGLVIWEALAEPCSRDDLVAALLDACNNVPEDEVAQHVDAFLGQLIAKGFVGIRRTVL